MEERIYYAQKTENDVQIKATAANDLATIINAQGDNSRFRITEDITVTSTQEITINGFTLDCDEGVSIICNDNLLEVFKISSPTFRITSLNITCGGSIASALVLNGNGNVSNVKVVMNGVGKTLSNAIRVESGRIVNVNGSTQAVNGTITNKISDVDGNSSFTIDGTFYANTIVGNNVAATSVNATDVEATNVMANNHTGANFTGNVSMITNMTGLNVTAVTIEGAVYD